MKERNMSLNMGSMKLLFAFSFLLVMSLAEEKYEEIGENFDISEVLQNGRLLKSYVACLLSKGPCTPEVKKIKDKLPEALETRCGKCTEKQKQIGKQLSQEVKRQYPQLWEQLVAKYDPDAKYQEAFEDFLKF